MDWRDEGSYDREDFDRGVTASGPRHVTSSRPAPSPEGQPLVRLGVSMSAVGYTGGDGAGADGGGRPFLSRDHRPERGDAGALRRGRALRVRRCPDSDTGRIGDGQGAGGQG